MENLIEERWRRFGLWLAEEREKRGLKQIQAAELMGVHKQEWHRFEKGRSTTQKTVIAIAEALKLDPNEALKRAGFQPLTETIEEAPEYFLFRRVGKNSLEPMTNPDLLATIGRVIDDFEKK